jgi:DNA-binding PadR family transcriptional regulator
VSGNGEHAALAEQQRAHGLTTTSFAVLGLLAMREWTTYELAHQMKRSFSYFWPRAERRIYDEPARLAAAGYAQSRRDLVGRRPRTCWQITPEGRDALHAWLGEPPTTPRTMEFEGLVKVFLAPQGSKRQLLDTLAVIEHNAEQRRRELAEMSAEIVADGGRFPERIHVNALAMQYMVAVSELTAQWARDAADTVGAWRSTAAPGARARDAARAEFAEFAEPRLPS